MEDFKSPESSKKQLVRAKLPDHEAYKFRSANVNNQLESGGSEEAFWIPIPARARNCFDLKDG